MVLPFARKTVSISQDTEIPNLGMLQMKWCVDGGVLRSSSTLGEEEEVCSVVAQGREEVVMDGEQAL